MLYKFINARSGRSTALVTNIEFEAWGEYLGDPPLAMAFLDRIVDGAIIMKLKGKSYRCPPRRADFSRPIDDEVRLQPGAAVRQQLAGLRLGSQTPPA